MTLENLKRIPIEHIKRVSNQTFQKLHDLGIHTVYDLLFYFPYRYENYEVVDLRLAHHNEKVTTVGTIISDPVISFYKRQKSRLIFRIRVDEMIIKVVAFNRHFLKEQLKKGMMVTVTGKYDKYRQQITAQILKPKSLDFNRIEPLYTLKTLSRQTFLNCIRKALEQFGNHLNEELPLSLLRHYRLVDIRTLVEFIHFPQNAEQIRQVERRVKYEELLKFQLKMYYLKYRRRKAYQQCAKVVDDKKVESFIQRLPFVLTEDQQRVVGEIIADLKAPYMMNRLLQGDVGSGKTVVAGIGIFATIQAGWQCAVMAPTEILAQQHYNTFAELFAGEPIRMELLTSSTSQKNKKVIYEKLKDGEIDLIIGTHALIVDDVSFKQLGLIVIDEQHRFGVNQRKTLREKGLYPDALFLSATPIPRTLSLTVFGDMDVSQIKTLPKGRHPVKTYVIPTKLEPRLFAFIEKTCSKGEQVYVIAPLIEESEKMDLENAEDIFRRYHARFGQRYRVGLLHGRMSNEEKEMIMQQFKDNIIQILVTTTVVEVGVDVPNATLMIVVDAHRFGLAQLHQLRGRVGRGQKQSYCILMSDQSTDKAQERLAIMTQTNDGFEIAEADLRMRGPGDFFGSRQSGLPEFKMADLINDYNILEVARQDAQQIIDSNELLTNPDYHPLREYIEREIIESHEYFD